MPAPKGNQFWKARTSYGTEKLFSDPKVLWEAACEYFQWVEDHPLWEDKPVVQQGEVIQNTVAKMRAMTVDGLCFFLGISLQTLNNYGEREGYEDYFDVVANIKHVIRDQKFSGASAGLLNANIIARDLGLADSSKQELTGANGGAIKTESKVEWVVQPVKPVNEEDD